MPKCPNCNKEVYFGKLIVYILLKYCVKYINVIIRYDLYDAEYQSISLIIHQLVMEVYTTMRKWMYLSN